MSVGLLESAPALAAAMSAWRKNSPGLLFEPRFYDASGDGKSLDTQAINATINSCHQAGCGPRLSAHVEDVCCWDTPGRC